MAEPRESWWARRPWLAAVLLYLPMAAVYGLPLLFPPPGVWPTGFVQYDQVEYMALAREYFDRGFGLLYGLPFSDDSATPRIYFQPWTFVLGLVWKATDGDPGRLYLAFGALSGLAMVRVALALWRRVVPPIGFASTLGLVVFVWGGGLFFLSGLAGNLLEGQLELRSLWRYEPAEGLWFLNLGRNLFFSTEAFYHLLTLGSIVALIDRRFALAAALLALLAASHPFTGAQYLAITFAWCLLELLLRRKPPPLWLPLGIGLLALLTAAYYLFALPLLSDEHAGLARRWQDEPEAWYLSIEAHVLGYLLVAVPAIAALRRGALHAPGPRLFAVMAGVSLVLANHELFAPPHQPLHFTRGHIWTGLFLLGAPVLVAWLQNFLQRGHRVLAFAAVSLLLLDNAVWLGLQLRNNLLGAGYAMELRPAERDLLAALNAPPYRDHLLVADEELLSYFAMTYTPLRSWSSHLLLTPEAEQRIAQIARWRSEGREPPQWRERAMLFVWSDGEADPAALPWVTPDSEIERIAGFLVIRRPSQAAE